MNLYDIMTTMTAPWQRPVPKQYTDTCVCVHVYTANFNVLHLLEWNEHNTCKFN